MNKKKLFFFYVITFGIGYFYLKAKAKKQSNIINETLTTTEKIPFSLDTLFSSLGGKGNFVKSTSTINSIKIFVKDVKLINQDGLKKIGAKGLIISEDSITCLFGDFSQSLHDLLSKNL